MSKDKWKMFKQFLHNELGLTKEDIMLWTKEAVQDSANRIVHEMNLDHIITTEIKTQLRNRYNNELNVDIKKYVAAELSKKLYIGVTEEK